eukprot:SAG31_NODE_7_length_42755_cov_130.245728_32_plen_99_part_00
MRLCLLAFTCVDCCTPDDAIAKFYVRNHTMCPIMILNWIDIQLHYSRGYFRLKGKHSTFSRVLVTRYLDMNPELCCRRLEDTVNRYVVESPHRIITAI